MAHPETPEAVDAPATLSMADASAVFADDTDNEEILTEDVDPDDGEIEFGEDEDQGDEADEPETAIDAPVSLNAKEKEAFAAASPEAQQAWAASETRRNAQVQEATTKASEAQRMAEARAAQADAEAKAVFAQQLDVFVAEFAPRAPDIRQYNDQLAYLTDKAQYDDAKAQHDELVQHVRGIQTEANTEAEQAFFAQRDRELMSIPEVANPETRQGYLDRVMEAAELLGYDRDTLARNANAADISAIAQAAEWKAKADRFDKAMAKQMQKVRAQKGKSLRPGAAQQESSGASGPSSKAMQAYQKNPSNRAAAAAVFENI